MKNALILFLTPLFLILVSCSSNPLETEAYKKMHVGYQELEATYIEMSQQLLNFNIAVPEMQAVLDRIEKPSAELSKTIEEFGTLIDMNEKLVARHNAVIELQKEKIAAHANMKMPEIQNSFQEITSVMDNIMKEVTSVKAMVVSKRDKFQELYRVESVAK